MLTNQGYACQELENQRYTCLKRTPLVNVNIAEATRIAQEQAGNILNFPSSNRRPLFLEARGSAHHWNTRTGFTLNNRTYTNYQYIVERNKDRIVLTTASETTEMLVLATGELGLIRRVQSNPNPQTTVTRTYLAIYRLN